MRGFAALAALLLASCGSSSVCAGDQQGTLVFAFQAVTPPPATSCGFFSTLVGSGSALPATHFTAAVSWRGPGVVALCVQAPLAVDRLGSYAAAGASAWTLDVPPPAGITTAAAGAVGSCPCAVDVAESLHGTLTRDAEQKLSFAGTLTATLTRDTGAASCYAAHGAPGDLDDCPAAGLSCTVDYAAP